MTQHPSTGQHSSIQRMTLHLPLINTFAAVTKSTEAAFQASPGLASCLRGNWYLEAALATNLEQMGGRGNQIKCQKLHDSTNANYTYTTVQLLHYMQTLLPTHRLALCL